jgi:hypothetical protein
LKLNLLETKVEYQDVNEAQEFEVCVSMKLNLEHVVYHNFHEG